MIKLTPVTMHPGETILPPHFGRMVRRAWWAIPVVILVNALIWGGLLYGAYRFGVYQGWLR